MSWIKRTLGNMTTREQRAAYVRERAAQLHAKGLDRASIGDILKRELGSGRRAGRRNPASVGTIVKVSFTGIKELDDKFATLNESLQKKALRKATRAVAKMVLAEAKAEVRHDTGLLERSLKVKAKKRSRKYPQTVGLTVGFEDDLFKGDTFYAGFLEFGTEPRQTKKTKTPANRGRIEEGKFDFLRAALWSYPEKKQAIFRDELLKWIREQQLKGVMT